MSDDTISRQAAIDALTHFTNLSWDKLKIVYPMLTVIEELPSAERRGRWTTERTMEHDGEWYCSVCGYEPTVYEASNYCPNCGAKMEGEKE